MRRRGDGGAHASGIEDGVLLLERLALLEQREELAARAVLEHHVQALGVFEGGDQLDEEGVVSLGEDLLLGEDVRLRTSTGR